MKKLKLELIKMLKANNMTLIKLKRAGLRNGLKAYAYTFENNTTKEIGLKFAYRNK